MNCPKCGFPRQPESDECPKCGIIYDKYEKFIKSRQSGDVRKIRVENKIPKKELVKAFFKKIPVKKRISQLTSFQKSALILFGVLIISIGIGFMVFEPDISVNGEISIAAKEGQKIKPGSVEVKVFKMETLLTYLSERKKERNEQLPMLLNKIAAAKIEYDAAFQNAQNAFQWDFENFDKAIKTRDASKRKWLKLRADEKDMTSCNFFFRELPVPLISTKTNSEGKFNILIPGSGLHVIAASATRPGPAVDDVETYYWLTTIDPKNGSRQTVILSNDTRVSAGDIEALIDMNEY